MLTFSARSDRDKPEYLPLMPWACGCILEGLAGGLWDEGRND